LVPAAENAGLIRAIDRWVLGEALRELATDPAVVLAINVSAFTATDACWMGDFQALAGAQPAITTRLIVEITETVAMHDIAGAISFAHQVKQSGARVALDDFGSGYTAFSHLRDLPLDLVKIDGSFTASLHQGRDNHRLLATLIHLAEGFGLQTVAECAETAEDVAMLREAGATYIQGYYFGRPSLTRG
jgi:EAL domain-containing protein (putative c-di-GMP-specific phosphodiesterase class I)